MLRKILYLYKMYSYAVGHRLPVSSLQSILMPIMSYIVIEHEGADGIRLRKRILYLDKHIRKQQ